MATKARPRSVPWAKFADAILGYYAEQKGAPSTIDTRRQALGMLSGLGAEMSRDLDDEMIRRFDEAVSAKGLRYRINMMIAVKSICRIAVELRLLPRSPVFPRIPHQNTLGRGKRSTAPPGKDVARTLCHLRARSGESWEHGRIHALAELSALAGVKVRDALRLKVTDIDLAARTIRITKPRLGREFPVLIRIPAELADTLASWLGRVGSEWAFPIKGRGKPWDPRFNDSGRLPGKPVQQLQSLAREAGVEGITFEKLRRYFSENNERMPRGIELDTGQESATPGDVQDLAVKLGTPGDPPDVWGTPKRPLTGGEYLLVAALVQAGKTGLTSGQLTLVLGGKKGAITTLARLKRKDVDWDRAIIFPGNPYGRYRIAGALRGK